MNKRKRREYTRPEPKAFRDERLFAIACEDSNRAPDYFRYFALMRKNRVSVEIIEDQINPEEAEARSGHPSSPNRVLNRATLYAEQKDIQADDELWFVIDVDRWTFEQIDTLAQHCNAISNWHIAISNPCFEVWLCLHKREHLDGISITAAKEFKSLLNTLEPGGYHPLTFIHDAGRACANARAADTHPAHYKPEIRETKVYLLVENLLRYIGANAFEDFIERQLPPMLEEHKSALAIKKAERKKAK